MMKVIKVSKQGFCNGVKRALNLVHQTVRDNRENLPVYILGELMNNKYVSNELEKLGVITVKAKGRKRIEMLDDISEGIVILTAHGVSPNVIDTLIKRKLKYVDTTCPFILNTASIIGKHLKDNYNVIYIGKDNHPESEGILGINPELIHLVTEVDDIEKLNISNDKILITTQTTLRKNLLDSIKNALLDKYPHAIFVDGVCNSTILRQQALINEIEGDLCLVVGDKISSNANELVKIGSRFIKTYLINSIEDIKKEWLTGVKVITLTSAASTPDELTNKIYEYLVNV
ncbi:MAG: 4-hydroxy-3-methylbut-2-enyl diphosphate reductase [Acholeplasmataceae bacterium]|jgi:4-hydroxy-3-methylbut-2-enyl diphosphate reductase